MARRRVRGSAARTGAAVRVPDRVGGGDRAARPRGRRRGGLPIALRRGRNVRTGNEADLPYENELRAGGGRVGSVGAPARAPSPGRARRSCAAHPPAVGAPGGVSGERLTVATPRGEVSAVWEPADGPVIVVGHGAGAGMEHPFIVGFCEALAGEGLASLRFNFPYMEAGRRTPDQATNGVAAFRAAFDAATERGDGRPVLAGGKSYGGRIASMAAADGMPARALVFLGYPLHPPGKP